MEKFLIYKKVVVFMVLCFLSGMAYAENRTGKVVHIENATAMGDLIKYVYLDSNNDSIIDAIFVIGGQFSESSVNIGIVLCGYINLGSSIVYNFDNEKVNRRIFLADSESIISIDGIAKNRMFADH